MKNVIIGTAGHIDHGKSALVEALTGTHPDRLEEERRRGITIDLGFAFLETADVRLGFIDVPGHERFVRNMLAGVGGIDLVLFVIAADEGIKPQTREHFDICRLLEIPAGLIALTKSDVVDRERLAVARREMSEHVRGSFLDGAPILSVSARTGEGIPELREALLKMASMVAVKDSSRHFRLPIDRAFAVKGFGTVVTGTLVSGQMEPEDEVELLPPKRRLRVRGIQSGGKTHSLAIAGQRTALNLAAIEAGELQRGMVLVAPGMFSATKRIDVRISLPRSASKPLKNRARVHFHQGAAQTVAEAVLLDRAALVPGEFCFAQLVLQDEIFVLPGDRFILRQFSPVITIGGGKVLDAHPRRHRARDAGTLQFLDILDRGSREEILKALVKAAPNGIVLDEIVRRTGWRSAEIEHMAEALIKSGDAVTLNRKSLNLASSEQVSACALRVTKVVSEFHRANPLGEGIAKEVLRAEAGGGREVFDAALRGLTAAGTISVSGDTIKGAGHSVTLNDAEARARGQIESVFEEAGFAAPASEEVLASVAVEAARAQKILQLLLREGVLIRVSTDLIYHRNALARLREALKTYGRSHANSIKVADFKGLAGISRKYAIPLLEYLDRTGVTRRQGDERVILYP
ncbi:MAG TPA: selenocysteine-specific translation elongation factor [Candidatus Acidoferrales bacterium]|nr:selenocysteine-specific translation elongation factor [Candidatus Acidoferrales bacterium]